MSDLHNLIIENIAEKNDLTPSVVQEILDDYFNLIGGLKNGKNALNPKRSTIINNAVANMGGSTQKKPPLITGAGISKIQLQQLDETLKRYFIKAKFDV